MISCFTRLSSHSCVKSAAVQSISLSLATLRLLCLLTVQSSFPQLCTNSLKASQRQEEVHQFGAPKGGFLLVLTNPSFG